MAPVYDQLMVDFHVGGERAPTWPLGEPIVSGDGLSLDDLRLGVERLHAARTGGDRPLFGRLSIWAALDPFEHSHPAAVWSYLRDAEIGMQDFQRSEESRLAPTNGHRIASDRDWRSMLEEFQQAGLRHVWFTCMGLEATHDALCGRAGAFHEITTAMERCSRIGLDTGANIVVSKRNVGEIAELGRLVRSLGGQQFVPTYVEGWTASESYEAIRPAPADLVDLPPVGMDVNWGYREFWKDLAAHTEGALTRTARHQASASGVGGGGTERTRSVLVSEDLDLIDGSIWDAPVGRIGNLRDDAPAEIWRRLAALDSLPEVPSDAELAARYGDLDGPTLFMSVAGLRGKWLAAWRKDVG